MQQERTFDIFVGAPRSGKSTLAAKLIKSYRENVIIVKHKANINDSTFAFLPEKNMSNWRQGVTPNGFVKCKMAFANKNKDYPVFMQWVIDHYRNGLLVIDDATIFERYQPSELLDELIAMRAHIGVDVVLIFHGFTRFPIGVLPFLNHFIIFNTSDNLKRKKDVLADFESIEEAVYKARSRYRSIEDRSDPKKYTPEIIKIT